MHCKIRGFFASAQLPGSFFVMPFHLGAGYQKVNQKAKTATVSNRRYRTGTNAVEAHTTLYIYLLAHFCLTVNK